jgi:hypothetical protein
MRALQLITTDLPQKAQVGLLCLTLLKAMQIAAEQRRPATIIRVPPKRRV